MRSYFLPFVILMETSVTGGASRGLALLWWPPQTGGDEMNARSLRRCERGLNVPMWCESSCVPDGESYARQPFILSHSFTNRFTHAATGSDSEKSIRQRGTEIHTAGGNRAPFSLVPHSLKVAPLIVIPPYHS